jgi:hypothetical protein
MHSDETAAIGSLMIATSLYLGSHFFNRHIDQRFTTTRRPDGLTAMWVVLGTIYTLIGAALLVALWAHRLPEQVALLASAVLGLHLAAFAVSGLPMLIGDINRTSAQRISREAQRRLHRK